MLDGNHNLFSTVGTVVESLTAYECALLPKAGVCTSIIDALTGVERYIFDHQYGGPQLSVYGLGSTVCVYRRREPYFDGCVSNVLMMYCCCTITVPHHGL